MAEESKRGKIDEDIVSLFREVLILEAIEQIYFPQKPQILTENSQYRKGLATSTERLLQYIEL